MFVSQFAIKSSVKMLERELETIKTHGDTSGTPQEVADYIELLDRQLAYQKTKLKKAGK